jgi:O-methyltransferase
VRCLARRQGDGGGNDALGERDVCRTIHLFDTFEGMPPQTSVDRAAKSGEPASLLLEQADTSSQIWAYAPLDHVRTNLASTGYPTDHVRFIAGRVEDTIPIEAPCKISILRPDTDWSQSTKRELVHLTQSSQFGES